MTELDILRWLHIIAMVYWLGGEWGVFQTSYKVIIPTLIITGISSLLGYGPFLAGEGEMWYSAKILTFGLALIIGVVLRFVMEEWQASFAVLAQGPNAEVEAKLTHSISRGRSVAYLYWVLILSAAFFGAVKPF